jgi:small subunit ribosomal protein S4
MPKRKHKKYSRPRRIYDASLIKEENELIKKYGLKNRKEVWRASFAVEKIRNLAKKLITADEKEKNDFVEKQTKKGFKVSSIADVLGLNKEEYLKRRLQSILVEKGLAKTHKQARQFITHKHIKLKGHFINSPSHLTTLEEETSIEITLSIPEKKEITEEEAKFLEKMKKKAEHKAGDIEKNSEEE